MIKDLSRKVGFYPNLNLETPSLQIKALTYKSFYFLKVNLAISPFLKKQQFSLEDDACTKQVANTQIHIKLVIGRVKDFDIFNI